MKPDNALEFRLPPDLSEAAIEDAVCMMRLNLTDGAVSVLITVSQWDLFRAAYIANNMTHTVINFTAKVRLDDTFDNGEWMVECGDQCVWSPGASG